jgi:hypothetical protein
VVAKAIKIIPGAKNPSPTSSYRINPQKKEHSLENHKDPYVTKTQQNDP